eukprot:TRINITY_DN26966_c0_g1_i1.p1 TRINITY_DN26966_c0_g1~~TRINITY_DN26966_c0_g1_i1.p1  ORF type:complete len:1143 (-),score=107.77 TRINITY_DN26966_c0_g1_i1:32-3460(-)
MEQHPLLAACALALLLGVRQVAGQFTTNTAYLHKLDGSSSYITGVTPDELYVLFAINNGMYPSNTIDLVFSEALFPTTGTPTPTVAVLNWPSATAVSGITATSTVTGTGPQTLQLTLAGSGVMSGGGTQYAVKVTSDLQALPGAATAVTIRGRSTGNGYSPYITVFNVVSAPTITLTPSSPTTGSTPTQLRLAFTQAAKRFAASNLVLNCNFPLFVQGLSGTGISYTGVTLDNTYTSTSAYKLTLPVSVDLPTGTSVTIEIGPPLLAEIFFAWRTSVVCTYGGESTIYTNSALTNVNAEWDQESVATFAVSGHPASGFYVHAAYPHRTDGGSAYAAGATPQELFIVFLCLSAGLSSGNSITLTSSVALFTTSGSPTPTVEIRSWPSGSAVAGVTATSSASSSGTVLTVSLTGGTLSVQTPYAIRVTSELIALPGAAAAVTIDGQATGNSASGATTVFNVVGAPTITLTPTNPLSGSTPTQLQIAFTQASRLDRISGRSTKVQIYSDTDHVFATGNTAGVSATGMTVLSCSASSAQLLSILLNAGVAPGDSVTITITSPMLAKLSVVWPTTVLMTYGSVQSDYTNSALTNMNTEWAGASGFGRIYVPGQTGFYIHAGFTGASDQHLASSSISELLIVFMLFDAAMTAGGQITITARSQIMFDSSAPNDFVVTLHNWDIATLTAVSGTGATARINSVGNVLTVTLNSGTLLTEVAYALKVPAHIKDRASYQEPMRIVGESTGNAASQETGIFWNIHPPTITVTSPDLNAGTQPWRIEFSFVSACRREAGEVIDLTYDQLVLASGQSTGVTSTGATFSSYLSYSSGGTSNGILLTLADALPAGTAVTIRISRPFPILPVLPALTGDVVFGWRGSGWVSPGYNTEWSNRAWTHVVPMAGSDPVARFGNVVRHFELPPKVLTPLLIAPDLEIHGSVFEGRSFEVHGAAFEGKSPEQWFDRIVIMSSEHSESRFLDIRVKTGLCELNRSKLARGQLATLDITLGLGTVESPNTVFKHEKFTDSIPFGFLGAHAFIRHVKRHHNLQFASIGGFPRECVDLAAPSLHFYVCSSPAAEYYGDLRNLSLEYVHLDLVFVEFKTSFEHIRGLLPELWGLHAMSESTTAVLKVESTQQKVESTCRRKVGSSCAQ